MKHLLLVLTIFSFFSSCAQSKKVAKKSYAFLLVRVAGTIAVGENGRPITKGVDSVRTIYVETAEGANPDWQTAWINRQPYTLIAVPLAEKLIQVGYSKSGENPIVINASAGNKLWRINPGAPVANKKMPGELKRTPGTNIFIEGTSNNKSFGFSVPLVTELKPVMGL